MRMFASDRVASIMERLKWPDDEPIEAKMVSRAVENAQKQIEELNYERRKNVLKYDEVMNGQREVIYGERRKILEGQDLDGAGARASSRTSCARRSSPLVPGRRRSRRTGTSTGSYTALHEIYPVQITKEQAGRGRRRRRARGDVRRGRAGGVRGQGSDASAPPVMRELERVVLLNITDTKWREHLYEMDYLQEGIHLRALRPEGPAHGVPARGLRHVPGAHGVDPGGLRALHLPGRVRADQDEQAPQPKRMQDNRAEVEHGGRCRGAHGDGQREPGGQRQDAAQRPVPVRQRQEVQEVPRRRRLAVLQRIRSDAPSAGSGSPARTGPARPRAGSPSPGRRLASRRTPVRGLSRSDRVFTTRRRTVASARRSETRCSTSAVPIRRPRASRWTASHEIFGRPVGGALLSSGTRARARRARRPGRAASAPRARTPGSPRPSRTSRGAKR